MVNYPPYVNSYGQLENLFNAIKVAQVPTKFTIDFLASVLDLKSSSYRPMIPLLKKLGFLDQANQPTQAYKDFRDESKSKFIMAGKIKEAYSELYQSHEYAHRLTKQQLNSKIKTISETGENDKVIPSVVGTFQELCKLANFESEYVKESNITDEKPALEGPTISPPKTKFGISYTINLNLPATTEIEVFNAIFKSLRENILYE